MSAINDRIKLVISKLDKLESEHGSFVLQHAILQKHFIYAVKHEEVKKE